MLEAENAGKMAKKLKVAKEAREQEAAKQAKELEAKMLRLRIMRWAKEFENKMGQREDCLAQGKPGNQPQPDAHYCGHTSLHHQGWEVAGGPIYQATSLHPPGILL